MMRAHLLQMDLAWEDREANFAKSRAMLDSITTSPGDFVVLPELFDSGFSLNVDITADEPPIGAGETRSFLSELASSRELIVHGSWTGLAPVDAGQPRGFNIAAAFGIDGSELYRYAKIHPFTFGREGERFEGGREVVCADIPGTGASDTIRVCPAVCYDLRFPELFRRGLDAGAEAFVIGANWPRARQSHWRALNIARAIENQAWVLCVNRVGSDPHLDYAGGSMVIDPQGRIVAEGDETEQVLSAEVSANAVNAWREKFPAWRDRSRYLR